MVFLTEGVLCGKICDELVIILEGRFREETSADHRVSESGKKSLQE